MKEKCTAALRKASQEAKPITRMAIVEDSDDESEFEDDLQIHKTSEHEKEQDLKSKTHFQEEEEYIEEIFNPLLKEEGKKSSSKSCMIEEIRSTRFSRT